MMIRQVGGEVTMASFAEVESPPRPMENDR